MKRRELEKALAREFAEAARAWSNTRVGRRQIESVADCSAHQLLGRDQAATTVLQLAIFGRVAQANLEYSEPGSQVLEWASQVIPAACRSVIHDWPLSRRRSKPLEQLVDQWNQARRAHHAAVHEHDDALVDSYEAFVAALDRSRRRHRGVFYTPHPIVEFMVSRLQRAVTDDLDDRVCYWDPSVGTGAFIVQLVRATHAAYTSQGQNDWQAYARDQLLPHLHGTELLLPAVFIAAVRLAVLLRDTGCRLDHTWPNPLRWCDSLSEELHREIQPDVIVGNPPYSANSTNHHSWIQELLHGNYSGSSESYYTLDDQPLKERKTWLHDDYVKFLRVAQMHVEQRGRGIVAMITNHGYLDNATFRGMRESIVHTFPRIEILDLHGNRKKYESPPKGLSNQNVFGIDQGVAISFWRKPATHVRRSVRYAELWGDQTQKLDRIQQQDLQYQRIKPTRPQYWLCPRRADAFAEYDRGIGIDELFVTYATAPVTARDQLVVAHNKRELIKRIRHFTNPDVADETIRRSFFGAPRTSRYPRGDTRSWKLRDIRRQLQSERDLAGRIVQCQYRPCDQRYIFWHPLMIDWPRRQVTDHLLDGSGLALVARRQMPMGQPRNYFWVTRQLGLDGLIRSDSLGSETLFPLWTAAGVSRQSNLSAEGESRFERLVQQARGKDIDRTYRIASYVYGLFHSSEYRQRYANALAHAYPRIPIPTSPQTFGQIADQGHHLILAHTMQIDIEDHAITRAIHVARGYPRLDSTQIHFSSRRCLGIGRAAVDWTVGAHQVLKKWLSARRDRNLGSAEQRQLAHILKAAEATQQAVSEVDRITSTAGGFARAFER